MIPSDSPDTTRKMIRLCLLYGLIITFVNYLGFLIPQSGGMPAFETSAYAEWMDFMHRHERIITGFSIISFVSPIVLCIYYSLSTRPVFISHFINLPFAYSAIGTLGWILSFILELICLLCSGMGINGEVYQIIFSSLANILQEAIFIFTCSFLILDFIHRRYVLPHFFPQGHLDRYAIRLKPSVRFLVFVFYFSVGIFPMFYLGSMLTITAHNAHIQPDSIIFVVLLFIIVFGIVCTLTLTNYFDSPLKKLKQGAEKVKAGDYQYHVDVVSNDSFGQLADTFNEMIVALDEKTRKIYAIQDSIIRGMAMMVESRDNSTGGHINRTSDCVKVFIRKLVSTERYSTLTPEFCSALIKAAPMHDLGKIAVDDAVLRKNGRFTGEEYEKMKAHSAEGARIVEQVLSQVDDAEFKQIAINVAHYHHEKWNGSGYPCNLSEERIPLEARIMALADVFDALVSKRCYKDSFSYDKAFSIIEESLGTHFDPELGRIFIDCRQDLELLYDGYKG